ncbi:MAG: hypothetical protein LC104_17780 [Bacteroidales bacterium]|nr:hypothetical protein [Bacteroidales bacterium]
MPSIFNRALTSSAPETYGVARRERGFRSLVSAIACRCAFLLLLVNSGVSLAQAEKPQAKADQKDPLVGGWLVQMPTKDGAVNMNVDFRSTGTVALKLTQQSRANLRRGNPRSNIPIASSGKWTKGADGAYRITFSGGMTWELTLTDEEHFDGKLLGGRPLRGVRQVMK